MSKIPVVGEMVLYRWSDADLATNEIKNLCEDAYYANNPIPTRLWQYYTIYGINPPHGDPGLGYIDQHEYCFVTAEQIERAMVRAIKRLRDYTTDREACDEVLMDRSDLWAINVPAGAERFVRVGEDQALVALGMVDQTPETQAAVNARMRA
jgi:hypothetical protein